MATHDAFPDPAVLADRSHPRYEAAWADLRRRLDGAVRRAVVAAGAGEEAEDVVNTVWGRAAIDFPPGLPRPAVAAWILRVARRAAVDARRGLARRAAREVPAVACDAATLEAAGARDAPTVLDGLVAAESLAERRAALARALADRPAHDRTLLACWAHGESHAEIAVRLDCTPAASRTRLAALLRLVRARAGLLLLAAAAPDSAPDGSGPRSGSATG